LGRVDEADRAQRAFADEYGGVGAYQVAQQNAQRGDADGAFEWLERAYAQRDGGITLLLGDPFLKALHDDPRWEALLEKVGLLQYWHEMTERAAAG